MQQSVVNYEHPSLTTMQCILKSKIAGIINRIGDYEQAIVMIDYAIALDSMAHDDIACSIDYNNKTVILMNMEKYEEAYSYSTKAVKLMEKIVRQS